MEASNIITAAFGILGVAIWTAYFGVRIWVARTGR